VNTVTNVRFEVFMAVRMMMLSSGFLHRVDSSVDASYSERHTVSESTRCQNPEQHHHGNKSSSFIRN
jgi:hypothetical protein